MKVGGSTQNLSFAVRASRASLAWQASLFRSKTPEQECWAQNSRATKQRHPGTRLHSKSHDQRRLCLYTLSICFPRLAGYKQSHSIFLLALQRETPDGRHLLSCFVSRLASPGLLGLTVALSTHCLVCLSGRRSMYLPMRSVVTFRKPLPQPAEPFFRALMIQDCDCRHLSKSTVAEGLERRLLVLTSC
jgi:hypothetical protein